MALFLLAAFIGVPILEIALFIQVGGFLGLLPTLGIVILTAVIGTFLMRQQGLATLNKARTTMNSGAMPLRELFDGACLLVSGVLLLTPGFFTDGLGFLLLLPPFRDVLREFLGKRVQLHATQGGFQAGMGPGMGAGMGPGMGAGPGPGYGPSGGPGAGPGFDPSAGHPFHSGGHRAGASRSAGSTIIDGDFREVPETEPQTEPQTEPDPQTTSPTEKTDPTPASDPVILPPSQGPR
ncbi:MAG: FxsA family protein [Rhodospirillaceae bacterium]